MWESRTYLCWDIQPIQLCVSCIFQLKETYDVDQRNTCFLELMTTNDFSKFMLILCVYKISCNILGVCIICYIKYLKNIKLQFTFLKNLRFHRLSLQERFYQAIHFVVLNRAWSISWVNNIFVLSFFLLRHAKEAHW